MKQATIIVPCYLKIGKYNYLNFNVFTKRHFHSQNMSKKKYTGMIMGDICELPKFNKPIELTYNFYLRNNRKCDTGNIFYILEKFFLDALQDGGRIKDDDFKHVIAGGYRFCGIDAQNPRCEILIKEVE